MGWRREDNIGDEKRPSRQNKIEVEVEEGGIKVWGVTGNSYFNTNPNGKVGFHMGLSLGNKLL